MTALTVATTEAAALRPLIDRAAMTLANAASAAEVLDARDQASLAYDAAKAAARFEKAKGAHDEIMASIYRSQADAAEIEFMAKRKLADEFDAAQARGEIAGHGGKRGNQHGKVEDDNVATTADLGLTRPQIHEARQIRDAIEAQPDLLRSVLDDMLQNGEEPTKAKVRKAIAPVVTTLRADATAAKKERRREREITLAGKIKALPNKKFGVIWADPEWKFKPFGEETGMDRAPDNHYPTSETDDICARDVPSIAANDCVLFLWATAPMLLDALRVVEAWGFEYKTHMIWAKERSGAARGTGYWFSGEHELLLVGTRGNVVAPAMGEQWRSVITARVGEHSEKPEVFLEMVEDYFPNVPKIELNRRGPARPGWDAWGLEADLPEEGQIDEIELSGQGPSATPREGGADPRMVSQMEAAAAFHVDLFARARAALTDVDPDYGRMMRATRVADQLGVEWDLAVKVVDRIEADDMAAAALLPPAPVPGEPFEFIAIEMRKSLHASGQVYRSEDDTFKVSHTYWLGYIGHSGPARGSHATFADALVAVIVDLRVAFRHVIIDTSGPCAKSHKAAAAKGLKWLDRQAGEWGLLQRVSARLQSIAAPAADPETLDLEYWISTQSASDIPAPTKDELIEYKMLGAIEAGLVVGGDMFDAFIFRGLVDVDDDRQVALSPLGLARSAELERKVKAHSDGGKSMAAKGGAA